MSMIGNCYHNLSIILMYYSKLLILFSFSFCKVTFHKLDIFSVSYRHIWRNKLWLPTIIDRSIQL